MLLLKFRFASSQAVVARPRTADKPPKLHKVEGLKQNSNQLRFPLREELQNGEVFISENAVQIMKFHGSYQQDNRDLREPGKQKLYQFMLRLKMPAGEFPYTLYQNLDDIAGKHGNGTLRATTRCAWQVHGILKSDLKTVFSSIMNAGGSCVGACGDLSRNVMCTPAPFVTQLYQHARYVSKMVGELFAPQSGAFSEIWLDGEKAASVEFWKNDLDMDKVGEIMRFDNGKGVVFNGHEEPIYGDTYLPRKFKVGVTVPGDNSIDIYTQDIGIICVPDSSGNVVGYNLIVGGGMGRTHRKESTFPRTGDHLGYVSSEHLWEALKAIVATQRDHGNRSIRVNARMKYLVDKLGIDGFRALVESYFGRQFEPFRELKPWKYEDWLGWHEQGDGNLFLGLFIEHGRIKDDGSFKLRTALRKIVDAYEFNMVITPNQNIILKDIAPFQREGIEAILRSHEVKLADEYDINRRISMACPALPLCGLATTEAERVMPSVVDRMSLLFNKMNVTVPITMRMTGCPNGCARPYMAEIGFVGSGPKTYQLWLGGCPNQTRLAWTYMEKADEGDLEDIITPVLDMYKKKSFPDEAFGDFCDRMGKTEIETYALDYAAGKRQARVTVLRSHPRVTVLPAPLSVVEKNGKLQIAVSNGTPKLSDTTASGGGAVAETYDITMVGSQDGKPNGSGTSSEASGGLSVSDSSSSATDGKKIGRKAKKARKMVKPRLTVSDEIMERLKNIAALRDMSASMVADEIISMYLSGVEDEDVAGEEN